MADAKLHIIKLPYPDKDGRTVWVYVPSHSDGEKLPVVYMTDRIFLTIIQLRTVRGRL